jgi:membrane-bound ClpP family serine protease
MGFNIGDISLNPWLIAVIVICVIIFLIIVIIWGRRAHRFKIGAGREEMIGKTAVVKTALDPKGTAFIEGEQWTAISESGKVEPGEEVTITKVDGLKIYVTNK